MKIRWVDPPLSRFRAERATCSFFRAPGASRRQFGPLLVPVGAQGAARGRKEASGERCSPPSGPTFDQFVSYFREFRNPSCARFLTRCRVHFSMAGRSVPFLFLLRAQTGDKRNLHTVHRQNAFFKVRSHAGAGRKKHERHQKRSKSEDEKRLHGRRKLTFVQHFW